MCVCVCVCVYTISLISYIKREKKTSLCLVKGTLTINFALLKSKEGNERLGDYAVFESSTKLKVLTHREGKEAAHYLFLTKKKKKLAMGHLCGSTG